MFRGFSLLMIIAIYLPAAFANCAYDISHDADEVSENSALEEFVTDGYEPLKNLKFISPKILGFTPLVSDTLFGGPNSATGQISVVSKLRDPNTQEDIATLAYAIDYEIPQRLETSDLNIQRKDVGLTRELTSRALRQNPHVREIREYLTGKQNAQAAKNLSAMTCKEAILKTDIVEMYHQLGFTKVLEAKCVGAPVKNGPYRTPRQPPLKEYQFEIVLALP